MNKTRTITISHSTGICCDCSDSLHIALKDMHCQRKHFSSLILARNLKKKNTLSHESPDAKPETVEQSEVVLYEGGGRVAGVRVVPLVRGEPARTRGESKVLVRKTQRTLTVDFESRPGIPALSQPSAATVCFKHVAPSQCNLVEG